MNLYIVVEGRRTEKKVYPAWLGHLVPSLSRVDLACEVNDNNYYLFNGNGFPSLLHNHLSNSIEEVNEIGTFDYLVLVMDVDETSIESRQSEVDDFMHANNLATNEAELVIIAQDRCLETWFLGNQIVYKPNPNRESLIEYVKFYNVKDSDPEKMGIYRGFNTHAQFHADYCKEFLRERNIRYTKNNPNGVVELPYLNRLIDRANNTGHLQSFKTFIQFCERINREIENTTANTR